MLEKEQQDKIINSIADYFEMDPAKLTPETNFENDLNADSIDRIELVMLLEDRFEMIVDDETAEKLVTIQDVFDYTEKHAGED